MVVHRDTWLLFPCGNSLRRKRFRVFLCFEDWGSNCATEGVCGTKVSLTVLASNRHPSPSQLQQVARGKRCERCEAGEERLDVECFEKARCSMETAATNAQETDANSKESCRLASAVAPCLCFAHARALASLNWHEPSDPSEPLTVYFDSK